MISSKLISCLIILNSFIELFSSLGQSEFTLTSIPCFENLVDEYLSIGEMNNAYLTYDQYISFAKNITTRFNSILSLSSIGKSYEGNDIPLIQFNTNKKGNQGILFTGMHHGREPVSMMMPIYILLKLIGDYNSLDPLFANTNIYFIPMINVDSYKYNCEQYLKTSDTRHSYSRKNRNKHSTSNYNCSNKDIGVDLNRNYDYFFGVDNSGSSNYKCASTYRGPHAFSEPETIAMKNFLINQKDIRIVVNYHTFGNLLIIPFNYASAKESYLKLRTMFPFQYDIYKEFASEGNFPKGIIIGNNIQTVSYLANGEASDWMLGVLGIIAFSSELGTNDGINDIFYPSKKVTFDILKENLPSALYSIQKACYFLHMDTIRSVYFKCNNNSIDITKWKCNNEDNIIIVHYLKIQNKGLGKYFKKDKARIEIIIEAPNVTIRELTIKIYNNSRNYLLYECTDFNNSKPKSKSNREKINFDLSIDIESRNQADMYVKVISDGLVNITYNEELSTETEWIYNKPSLKISDKDFTLINKEPIIPFNSIRKKNRVDTNHLKDILSGSKTA